MDTSQSSSIRKALSITLIVAAATLFINKKLVPTPAPTPTPITSTIPGITALFQSHTAQDKAVYRGYFNALAITIQNSTNLKTTEQLVSVVSSSVKSLSEIYPTIAKVPNLDKTVDSEFLGVNNGLPEDLTPQLRQKFSQKARDIATSIL